MGKLYGGFPRFRYVRAGIPAEQVRSFPFAALTNFAMGKLRLPLRLDEPFWVGRWVAANKRQLAPIVMANGTAHRFLFPALADTGRKLILERGSMHPEDYFHFPQRARKEAGYTHSDTLPATILDEIEKNTFADYLIAGSEMVRESYVRRGFPAHKAFTCRYGVDPSRFKWIDREPPRGRPIRIAAIGVIGFRKGLHRLLRMGEWADRKGIQIEIGFAGPVEDPEAEEMFARSHAKVHRFGVIKGPEFHEFLASCDLCSVFSYEEGLPVAMLEAMSTGLAPLVSTDTGAMEVPSDGIEGIHLTQFSDAEFDSKLTPLLTNPERIVEMGQQAAAKIRAGFQSSHYASRLQAILEQIAAE